MIVRKGSKIETLIDLGGFEIDLENALKKEIDIVTEETYTEDVKYENKYGKLAKKLFYNEVKKDRREIFG